MNHFGSESFENDAWVNFSSRRVIYFQELFPSKYQMFLIQFDKPNNIVRERMTHFFKISLQSPKILFNFSNRYTTFFWQKIILNANESFIDESLTNDSIVKNGWYLRSFVWKKTSKAVAEAESKMKSFANEWITFSNS